MRPFTFKYKVLLLAVGLVMAIQLITLFPVLGAIRRDVDERARRSVGIGGVVLEEFMQSRAEQLQTTVSILAADFAFRQAVAGGDRDTIRSALINHGARANASIAMLLDLDGRIVAASQGRPGETSESQLPRLTGTPEAGGATHAVMEIDGVAYQTVTVPLRAPVTIAWVVMGFQLDQELASHVEDLTGLETSFLRWRGERVEAIASTLPAASRVEALRLEPGMTEVSTLAPVGADEPGFLTLLRPFLSSPGRTADVFVALQLSMEEATAPYRRIRGILLVITSLSLLLAISGAFWLARTVTQPVQHLAGAARRMRAGVYTEPIAVRTRDELGELADSFNAMQEAIADRERRIVYQASHDSLSGLPNRDSVLEALGRLLQSGEPLSVVSIGLEDFARIRSSLGHHAGDEVIRLVAALIKGRLTERQEGAVLGHLGGGEFIVALAGADTTDAAQWVEDLAQVLHIGVRVEGANISLRMAAGVAHYPEHGAEASDLLRRAAVAESDARLRGEFVAAYDAVQDDRHLRRIRIIGDFPRAVRANELKLRFQPKIDCRSQDVRGVEALVRWEHPELGLLSPDQFVDVIEQSGAIGHLSRWVIREAAATAAQWRRDGIDLPVAVNVSADDLVDEYLPYYLLDMAGQHGLSPSSFTLEVTESAIMRNVQKSLTVLQCIREVGFRAAIDDFGTGQSSLAQLQRLPLDELKVDRSFVGPQATKTAIVRAMIDLAHSLGLEVVAEGVEDESVLVHLAGLGCDYAQGYFVSRPLDARQFCEWLGSWRQRRGGGPVDGLRGRSVAAADGRPERRPAGRGAS